jgi:hypothetical protein
LLIIFYYIIYPILLNQSYASRKSGKIYWTKS